MVEIQTRSEALAIDDHCERTFALVILTAFPHIRLDHRTAIVARSGKRSRITRPDFLLTNSLEQRLYVEVTSGDADTARKKRQHKTAKLAGLGSLHVTFIGSEIRHLEHVELSRLRQEILRLLHQRFTPGLFDFDPSG